MKKILMLFSVLMLIGATNIVVAQGNKKVVRAKKEVAKANEHLKNAKSDSASDFHRFKAEAQKSIAENKVKIANLKAQSPKDKSKEADEYNTKVLALEQKNNELQRRIESAKYTKQTLWVKFKNESKHDLDGLGNAIKDLFKGDTN